MSSSCYVYLPANVRIGDVASVIGMLVGCASEYSTFSSYPDSGSAKVLGVSIGSSGCVEMPRIQIGDRGFWFHYEGGFPPYRMVSFGAYSDNAPQIARGLVDFFGGFADFNDCDDVAVDYKKRARPNSQNCPSDGALWEKFQRRILAVEKIDKD